jgi:Cleaved Adhesin Domain
MSNRARWLVGACLISAVAIGCEQPSPAPPRGRTLALEVGADDAGALDDDDAGRAVRACPLLHEDFESGVFPSDWFRFDVDGQTPDFSVGFVDAAWVATAEIPPGDTSNHAAASTSYYRDWVAADDWMVTKALALPATQTCTLAWRARSDDAEFREDYEVRVFTSAPVLESLASDSRLLRAIAAESPSYTTHVQSLAEYAGQTIYLAFRNNAFDKFLLYVDDVTLTCE